MKPTSTLRLLGWTLWSGCMLASQGVAGQLIINQSQAPSTMVQNTLMGPGVFSFNVLFNGNPGNIVPPTGVGPSEIGRFNGSNTCLGINSGVFLCNGVANSHLPGPNDQMGAPGGGIVVGGGAPSLSTPDIDLSQLTGWPSWQVTGGGNIHSKAVLEFDFVPTKDMVSFRYVFSSEEYERWACSEYNDAFGFFISGPGIPTDINGPFTNNAMNIALVPGSMAPVSINTVNSGATVNNMNGPWNSMDPWENCAAADPNWLSNIPYYRYNGGQWPFPGAPGGAQLEAPYNTDPYYIQHNGMTVVLTASAAVQCGQTYHIKLALGNVNDAAFPSAVWLEGNSFTSSDRFKLTVDPGPTVEYTATDTILIENNCDSVYLRFHRLGGFYLDEDLEVEVSGTATNGVDVLPAIPALVHFNQLDSFAIVPIAVPVDVDGLEELVVRIITCNGTKVQTWTYPIDQRPELVTDLQDVTGICPGTYTLGPPTTTGGSNEPSNLSYEWSTGETTPTIDVTVDESEQFWVIVRDSCWALDVPDTAWVLLPAVDPLVAVVPGDTAIPCLGTAELIGSGTGGTAPYTYSWTLGGVQEATTPEVEVPAAVPSVYHVLTVTDDCGRTAADSVLVSQAPPTPLVVTLTPDTAIPCLGEAYLVALVQGGGGQISYAWSDGGPTIGTNDSLLVPAADLAHYTVTVNDQCGQTVTEQVEVTTGPTPPLLIEAYGDTVDCPGMEAVLQVVQVSGGGGAYRYEWDILPGTGVNNTPTLNVTITDDMYYTVTVTDECGNTADTTLAAIVMDHPALTLTASNDTVVCPGEMVPLWVSPAGGAGGYTISWPGLGTGSAVAWEAHGAGMSALVQVTDMCGTTATESVEVDVLPGSANIMATQLGDNMWNFTAQYDPPGSTTAWDLGDGTGSMVSSVTHTYAQLDAFWVVLTLTTPDGCVLEDSVRTRPPAATIYFPNTFTPDGDGFNDLFGGEGRLIEHYELWVFNRWGQVVFESKDMGVRWNGRTPDGEEVPQGIYQFKYRVEGTSMARKEGFGHINLLR